ncbi:MAG: hypothetical protein UX09_C0006G0008 [Candidatus Uhrbacteria bacterium GW2011_GWE2_45_35]|uniref:Uncharacterized protein n=2 Tax=Candidatus Uhriibacteriota TaxID=1752732 RepID=A0A0G1MLL8_9BACT|nr:MAG: hypothetical protein UX09_C0006G0008 [Candidatus Uhrbacteria bacterium GW2011_GWE2_45_35]HBR81133.1 hypothetical protein [Candidatus Uhrbacteria bacterium]HCU31631.1 hypothetical protein [Candidatus Uhrbacteria bacterium]
MKSILATIVALGQVYLLMPLTAMADVPMNLTDANTSLGEIGNTTGMGGAEDLTTVIGNLINVVLGVLGIIFLVLVVYAGFLYLTDQGGGEKAKKAMKLLTTAVIGIVIIVAAYAISNYVIGAMVAVTT